MKTREKEKAIELRQRGHSLREISEMLKISKSTASVWLRNTVLSKKALTRLDKKRIEGQRISQKVLRERTRKRLLNAEEEAELLVSSLNPNLNEEKVLCAMMYWCEGSKTVNDVDFAFTNSDPELVRTFVTLLRDCFEVEESKLRVHMHLHKYHTESKQKTFWSKVTGIPEKQFAKAYQKDNTGIQSKEGYMGCIRVRYHDVILAREIQAIARTYMHKVN